MPKKTKTAQLSDNPITIRVPRELRQRIDALAEKIGTQSATLRLALLEGVKALERRYTAD